MLFLHHSRSAVVSALLFVATLVMLLALLVSSLPGAALVTAGKLLGISPAVASAADADALAFADETLAVTPAQTETKVYLPLLATPAQAPTITDIQFNGEPLPATYSFPSTAPQSLSVGLTDPDSPLDALQLTVTSSNQEVIAAADLKVTLSYTSTFEVPTAWYTVEFTPTSPGVTNLTFTASDEQGGQATRTVEATIGNNQRPVASDIPDQTTSLNTPITVSFTVTDPDNDPLTFSNEIGPDRIATVAVEGSGDQRTITLTPTSVGQATVYIYISDGKESTAISFRLTVTP